MIVQAYQKKFICFFIISAFIWSVVPLIRRSLPMDTQEAIIWGKYCLWGTTKHPPFSGWIAYGFYQLFGQHDFALYLLSQIFVLTGLLGIYKLARCFLPQMQAILATAFQLGIIFYHFSATEFNVNVISLAIWPWCTYYFWQAYLHNQLKHWLLFGLLMGINLLNKYVGGVLAVALAVFVLVTPQARRLIKNPKAYLSVVACLIVCLPHLWWLYETDFRVLNYIATRNPVGKVTSVFKHIFYPVKFMLAQIMFAVPAVCTFLLFIRKEHTEQVEKKTEHVRFLLSIGCIPTLFWIIKSALWGTPLKDMWNFPSLFALGILFFYFICRKWSEQKASLFIKVMFGWSLFFAFIYAVQCVVTISPRFQSDCPQIVRLLTQEYQAQTGKPLRYVGGNIWFSDMVSLYTQDEVKPIIWMDAKANPWLDEKDIQNTGALVVAENKQEYEAYNAMYNNELTNFQQIDIIYQNRIGKTKVRPIYFGIYEGEKHEK